MDEQYVLLKTEKLVSSSGEVEHASKVSADSQNEVIKPPRQVNMIWTVRDHDELGLLIFCGSTYTF